MQDDAMQDRISRRDLFRTVAGATVSVLLLRVLPAEAGGDEKQARTYAYIIDTSKCIGCGNCVRACARENDVPDGRFRTWVERYIVTTHAGLLIQSPEGGRNGFPSPAIPDDEIAKAFFVPKMCNHCQKPPCVQVCPVGATFVAPTGPVLVDDKRCMGCGYCVQSCPYAARFMHPVNHTASKCSWCYHRVTKGLLPGCVTVCPTGTRRFGEVYPGSELHEFLLRESTTVLKGDLGTEPACHYLALPREVR